MPSTFLGLQIGKSGLTAAQVALNITGHNMSNADTDGYSRQRVTVSSVNPASGAYLINQKTPINNVGGGVEVLSIDQVRSSYLDQQYRSQNAAFSNSEYRTQGLTYLEGLFDELNDDNSLKISISDFFSALNDFTGDTTSKALRTNVQQKALSMTGNFNIIYNEMVDLYNQQNGSVETVMEQINTTAQQIAQYNDAIHKYELTGETANDLRDKRNLLLDKLSGYADITYSEDSTGMVNVQLAGQTLVDGVSTNPLDSFESTSAHGVTVLNSWAANLADLNQQIYTKANASPPEDTTSLEKQRDTACAQMSTMADVVFTTESNGMISASMGATALVSVDTTANTSAGATVTASDIGVYTNADAKNVIQLNGIVLTASDVNGELGAHMNLRDDGTVDNSGIPYYIDRLDELTRTIVKTVNECMNQGWTYPDAENGKLSKHGVDFFADGGIDTATDDAAATDLSEADLSQINAGNFTLSNAVKNSVWNIAGSDIKVGTDGSNAGNNKVALQMVNLLDKYGYSGDLNSIVSHLGIALQTSQSVLDTRQSLVESIDTQRSSVSGVNSDEETTNIIRYNRTYTACARVITAMDQMLEVMINNMGLVGR